MKNGIYEEIINNKILKEIDNYQLLIGKEKSQIIINGGNYYDSI